jgi:phage terminase small subunit
MKVRAFSVTSMGINTSRAKVLPAGRPQRRLRHGNWEDGGLKHEAFVQAYITNGMNATKAYRAVYPKTKSDRIAQAASSRLLSNVMVQARIAEIMRVGAERAEVTAEEVIRELKKLGFSCIGKAVTWRNEVVTQQLEEGEEGEPKTVLVPRVRIVPTEDLDKATLDAIAEVSQQANGALRVKMHDKHAALVSLGKHLGLFTHNVQIKAVYGISDKPMSAEEWKKQYVKPG